LAKDINVADLLKKIAELLQVDIDKSIQTKRLHGAVKRKQSNSTIYGLTTTART